MNKKKITISFVLLTLIVSGGVLVFRLKFDRAALLVSNTASNDWPVTEQHPVDLSGESTALPDNSNQFSKQGNFDIQGKVVTIDSQAIVGADLLVNIVNEQECDVTPPDVLELNNDTLITRSDDSGEFSIPIVTINSLTPKCLMISAAKEGYYDSVKAFPWKENSANAITIEVLPRKQLKGKVVDPNGILVKNATIQVWHELGSFSAFCQKVKPANLLTAISDSEGNFNVNVDVDTEHCIVASHADWASSKPQRVNVNVIEEQIRRERLAGSTLNLPGAEANEQSSTDVVLELQQALSLSGIVEDAEGRPIPNLALVLKRQFNPNMENSFDAKSDETGQFTFTPVDWGEFVLETNDNNFAISSPSGIIEINRSLSDLPVEVFPVSHLRGRVVDKVGDAIAGATVTVRSPFATSATTTQVISNNDGQFDLPSYHQSQKIQQTYQVAASLFEDDISSEELLNTVCIDIQHPNFGRHQQSLLLNNSGVDLDVIYLQEPQIRVRGHIVNHRGAPANLLFRAIADERAGSLTNLAPTCNDLSYDRRTQTNNNGEFSISLDSLGRYEVELESEHYWQKKIRLVITGGGEELEIRVD